MLALASGLPLHLIQNKSSLKFLPGIGPLLIRHWLCFAIYLGMENPLSEAWHANQDSNQRLLEHLEDEQLAWRYGPRVRTIGQVFAHLHHRRMAWLAAWGDVPEELVRIRRTDPSTTDFLSNHLSLSAVAMELGMASCLEACLVTGFGKPPIVFCSYLIAHEAHHRGQVIATLRIKGKPLSSAQIHSLWEWGSDSE